MFSALTGGLFRARQMAARRVLAGEIFVDELAESARPKLGKCPPWTTHGHRGASMVVR